MAGSLPIVGHAQAMAVLADPPTVSLLRGPSGVGKRTMALYVASHVLAVRPSEVVVVSHLDAGAASDLRERARFRPTGGARVVVLDLSTAQAGAANSLLKLLEEPPARHTFLLHSDVPVLSTIASRAVVLRCGLLRDYEVEAVLLGLGWEVMDAVDAAKRSAGRVSMAIESKGSVSSRGPVCSLLRATASGDADLLQNVISGLKAPEMAGLRSWAIEARSKRWRVFTPEDSHGLERDSKLQDVILSVTSGSPHPRSAVRVALWAATDRAGGRS